MGRHPERDSTRASARASLSIAGLVCFPLAIPTVASADETNGDLDRWVPSLSFSFEVVRQKADGSVNPGPILGPPLDPFDTDLDAQFPGNGCAIRPSPTSPIIGRSGALCPTNRPNPSQIDFSEQGSDTLVAPMVTGSLELMTPRLIRGFLEPRLFVHGDGSASFSFERNTAGRGSPGPFTVPPSAQTESDIEEPAIPGQGSRARWQLARRVGSAGGGVALTVTVYQHTFRIKPSFEWERMDQDFIGVTRRAVKQIAVSGTGTISAFRELSLNQERTRTFDGIGGGLEIEADTARL